jgi:KUP system potassium uptake protein
VLYALFIVISIKYIAIVMRADNQGEGGILALTALLPTGGRVAPLLIGLGIFGAALLYGDGMITPAISVLGAVEGLQVETPLFTPYVVPMSVAILVVLFLFQKYGTHQVGRLFGPIMVLWFLTIAVLGSRGSSRSRRLSERSTRSMPSPISANTVCRVSRYSVRYSWP